ncbi:Ceramide-1-phosphate transfer protein [Cryptotermes secundus]|uniref:Ceramide-1-phosphate transfer protein n=1 Tax=Cryptotermes secundus TaxID=105785 RepID=A0A2J7QUW1_9NEOP|nr:ceramide-1-phosphate transfer protein [Cryptotermes secundus]PNF32371.1 Ceramide-1-phosphate transfer protein [Cryptotermes secundus]
MATSEMDGKNSDVKFNMCAVHDAFSACLLEDDDVEMDSYLLAYKELYIFFQLMGKVFAFVASDVKSKIEILEELRQGENGEHFSTLKKMIRYESENGLLNKSGYTSGSRTLLRLHRGLDFIKLFLQKVSELQDEDKTCGVCQEAYNSTLANFHPWIIRKGATVAMYALPSREGLLQKVCGPDEVQDAIDILPKMLQVTGDAYDRTQKHYTENDLHGLP